MKRLGLALLLAQLCGCSFLSNYTLPPISPVPPSPTAADWPDAPVVILEDVARLEYRLVYFPETHSQKLAAVLDHRRRMKILREEGLAFSDVKLPIDGYSTVTRVTGRSVSPSGETNALGRGNTRIEAREQAHERSPDLKVLHFDIPKAEVGGVLEYRYERIYVEPLLVEPFVFGQAVPVVYAELALAVPAEVTVDYVYGHGDKLVEQPPTRRRGNDGREELVFIENDLPGYFHEPYMPHVTRLAPWIAVSLRALRLRNTIARVNNWGTVAEWVEGLMSQVRISPADGTPAERYALVRDVLTPLNLPGLGVRQPQTGPSLADGAPACSRDASATLLAALQGARLEAYPALLTGPNGPPLAMHTPSTYPFIKVVVAARVEEKMLREQNCAGPYLKRGSLCGLTPNSFIYLDPLCKRCAYGVLPGELVGGKALILKPQEPFWVDMPLDPPERHFANVRADWEMDSRGKLLGIINGEMRGTQAQALRDDLPEATAPNSRTVRTQRIREALLGDVSETLKVSGGKLVDEEKTDASLGIFARLASVAEPRPNHQFRLRAVDLFGNSIPQAWRPMRRLQAVTQGPRWLEISAQINLPADFKSTCKAPVKVSSPFADYAAGFTCHDNKLTYARRFVLKAHSISVAQWPAFADFFEQVRVAESDGPVVWEVE